MGHSFRYIFSRSLNCAWLKCSIAKYIEEGHDNKNLKEVLPPTFVIIRNKYILMYNTICLHIRPTFEHENVAIQTSSNTKTIFTGKVLPLIKVIRYDIFFCWNDYYYTEIVFYVDECAKIGGFVSSAWTDINFVMKDMPSLGK